MSKKGPEQKNMSSIALRLHGQLVRTKLGLFFSANLFLFVATSIICLFQIDWQYFGSDFPQSIIDNFNGDITRNLTTRGEGLSNLTYVVKSGDEVLINENVFTQFNLIIALIIIAILFQCINLIAAYYGEYRKIKKILNPINEMAIRADEMSRMSFDEAKFHTIENAIEHISPEQTTEMSLGDSDLQGIEAAMNNMLSRMHDTYLQQARFVNDASHELRTPISVIQGYANMLDRWGKEDEEILDESIAAIKNESDHMNHLVEQLLFLARGDAGRNTMTFEDVCLNDIMKEIYEESLMIDENHIYKFRETTSNVHINADASMIKQAMRILVDNAAKYTAQGDEIALSVGLTNEGGRPYIQVQDNGIGMAEVDVKHMFERFYRADDTRKVQGTGLGLSIAKWIVDKHKGHFEIISRKEIGTRITIVFN
ncbi:Signal transduction histidine kinase [Lachnospiraceae bacterium NE2001]|nr:Signal transduction histidine kinase [Lachnospiraceae bacterium NE2001]